MFLPTTRTQMNSLFDGIFGLPVMEQFIPDLDVTETDSAYVVRAEIPGVDEKDVEISFKHGRLFIKGEKKSESTLAYWSERTYGKFNRTMTFQNVNGSAIEAVFSKGVLTITLPKTEIASHVVPIRIQ